MAYLRYCKKVMGDIPVALNLETNLGLLTVLIVKSTLNFMKQEGWVHAIADEPQAGSDRSRLCP